MAEADWVSRFADEVIAEAERRAPGKPIVCASGLSPSGPIHLGNLREVMTPHLVADEIRRRGVPCDHLLSWDDYDRLRRVPAGIDPAWNEHIGKVSGYNYIVPAGRIAGDVWGNCGSDAYHMQHYRTVDNTMRAYPEIAANWAGAGITPDKWVAFYCGTGWRASETWFYAYVMGWKNIAVYDGGWFEWSKDPLANPIEIGEPEGAAEEVVA